MIHVSNKHYWLLISYKIIFHIKTKKYIIFKNYKLYKLYKFYNYDYNKTKNIKFYKILTINIVKQNNLINKRIYF